VSGVLQFGGQKWSLVVKSGQAQNASACAVIAISKTVVKSGHEWSEVVRG
jgi:hypothetical protein